MSGWSLTLKDVAFHILKHIFTQNFVSKNVNIVPIQKLLEHSSLNDCYIYAYKLPLAS